MNRIANWRHIRSFCALILGVSIAWPAYAAAEKAVKPEVSAPAIVQPAQQTAGGPLKPSEVRNFQDWTMRCFSVQTAAPCDVFQMVIKKDTKQRVLNVSIAYAPRDNSYVAQFVVPWGLALEKGLTIEAGKYSAKGLPFRRCSVEGCYVEGRLDSATVDALTRTKLKATLKITSYEGKPINLPLSLNGFAAALQSMKTTARSKMP